MKARALALLLPGVVIVTALVMLFARQRKLDAGLPPVEKLFHRRRVNHVVRGTVDGVAMAYANRTGHETIWTDVTATVPDRGAELIARPPDYAVDGAPAELIDADVRKQLEGAHPDLVSLSGGELRVVSAHLVRDSDEALALVHVTEALATRAAKLPQAGAPDPAMRARHDTARSDLRGEPETWSTRTLLILLIACAIVAFGIGFGLRR